MRFVMRASAPGEVLDLLGVIGILITLTVSPVLERDARADAPPANVRKQASELFARGEALFRIGDYARAAQLFEEANAVAPHPDILWNAARSYERAGSFAAAANAYADYLARSPETAPDRRDAVLALERLTRKVGRVDVHAPPGAIIVVDERPSKATTYLAPGSHVVTATLDARTESYPVNVEPAEIRSLSVLAPPAPDPAPTPAPPPPSSDVSERPASRGLSPWFFAGGAVLTAAAAGVGVAFAVDTQRARSDFDANPSQTGFDAGRDKQLRTNVTFAVAGGLALLTAVTGIWLVDWSSPRTVAGVTVRPDLGGVSGTF